jgi:hypothetical protein
MLKGIRLAKFQSCYVSQFSCIGSSSWELLLGSLRTLPQFSQPRRRKIPSSSIKPRLYVDEQYETVLGTLTTSQNPRQKRGDPPRAVIGWRRSFRKIGGEMKTMV